MAQLVRGAAVVAAGVGALAAGRVIVLARGQKGWPMPRSNDGGQARWHAVTVYRERPEVTPEGHLPTPLADLGEAVFIRLEDAPGGKGTEIHVRPAEKLPEGWDLERLTRQIRAALRTSKMLLETREILSPDRPGSTRPTPLNAPLRYATAHGLEEGRL
jgi:hypothetical protein